MLWKWANSRIETGEEVHGEADIHSAAVVLRPQQLHGHAVAGGPLDIPRRLQPSRFHAGGAEGGDAELLVEQLPRGGWVRAGLQGVRRRQGEAGAEGPGGRREGPGLGGLAGSQGMAGERRCR